MVIRWEDPPANRMDWTPIVEALQSHPGIWACVRDAEFTSRSAAHSTWKRLKERGCEATVRKVEGQGHGVWARWPQPCAPEATQIQTNPTINRAARRESIVA